MNATNKTKPYPKVALRKRLMSHLIQTVPEDSAICEFDCNKPECSQHEWQHCKRRLERITEKCR